MWTVIEGNFFSESTANGSASPTEERQAPRVNSFRACSDPPRNQQPHIPTNLKQKPPTLENLLLHVHSLRSRQVLTLTPWSSFRNQRKLEAWNLKLETLLKMFKRFSGGRGYFQDQHRFHTVEWRLKAGLTESRRAPSAKQRHANTTGKTASNS
jgi:hypothetical protein